MNFAFGLLANVNLVFSLSVAIGISGLALYFRERKEHRKTRERLTGRLAELEQSIDPNRRSSKLGPKGLTRVDDK